MKPMFRFLADPDQLWECVHGNIKKNLNASLNSLIWKLGPKTTFSSYMVFKLAIYMMLLLFLMMKTYGEWRFYSAWASGMVHSFYSLLQKLTVIVGQELIKQEYAFGTHPSLRTVLIADLSVRSTFTLRTDLTSSVLCWLSNTSFKIEHIVLILSSHRVEPLSTLFAYHPLLYLPKFSPTSCKIW